MFFVFIFVVGGFFVVVMIVGIGLCSDGWFFVSIFVLVFGLYIWVWICVGCIGVRFEEEGVVVKFWFLII